MVKESNQKQLVTLNTKLIRNFRHLNGKINKDEVIACDARPPSCFSSGRGKLVASVVFSAFAAVGFRAKDWVGSGKTVLPA